MKCDVKIFSSTHLRLRFAPTHSFGSWNSFKKLLKLFCSWGSWEITWNCSSHRLFCLFILLCFESTPKRNFILVFTCLHTKWYKMIFKFSIHVWDSWIYSTFSLFMCAYRSQKELQRLSQGTSTTSFSIHRCVFALVRCLSSLCCYLTYFYFLLCLSSWILKYKDIKLQRKQIISRLLFEKNLKEITHHNKLFNVYKRDNLHLT